jgi:hypothetical protein
MASFESQETTINHFFILQLWDSVLMTWWPALMQEDGQFPLLYKEFWPSTGGQSDSNTGWRMKAHDHHSLFHALSLQYFVVCCLGGTYVLAHQDTKAILAYLQPIIDPEIYTQLARA